ncbi:tryptophan-rich sensory protein [Nocardia grenadensis]|uniref:tryptophan-rich sensory protein n=1 Tax=Nocardia grenadensis TaxID=931537 RepID=UPI003D75C470
MTDRTSDTSRQLLLAAAAVVAAVAAVIGSGALGGTPIAEAAGGALAADATFVAPAGPAFAIWSLLYIGFLALAVWQALPAQRGNPRVRDLWWLIALSLLLNALWIATVQFGWVYASAVVIVVLLVTLAVVFARCLRTRPASPVEAVLLDGVMGLYLGWVVVATVANIAAALKAGDVGGLGLGAEPWAVVVLVLAAAVGAGLAFVSGGRPAFALAIIWGLGWIGVGRLAGSPESVLVGGVAVAAAVVVALATGAARLRWVASARSARAATTS